jgi:FkbM family methyltransferase
MKSFFKALFNALPFKKPLFTGFRKLWTPPEVIYRHLYFYDDFEVRINDSQKFRVNHFGYWIENEIFWRGITGNWEKESLKLWIKLCEKSNVIYDIGANTGIYSLVAKAVNPTATVHAFEPHPVFFDFLTRNISLNGYDIVAHKKAISDSDGTIFIEDYSGEQPHISVESQKLDTFIEQSKTAKPDLIKIDVESHEPMLLEGFRKYLTHYKPIILIEILNDEVAGKVAAYVKDCGYLYFNIDERGSVRQTNQITKSDFYNFLFCDRQTAIELGLVS